MSESQVTPDILAAGLTARLIHDIAGSLYGVTSGLELHDQSDQAAMKAEGLKLISSSAASMTDLLAYLRAAFGGAGEPQGAESLEALARTQFAGKRAQLVWSPTIPALAAAPTQGLLILAQIAAGGLPLGGTAEIMAARSGGTFVIRVKGRSPRAQLQPEAVEGLAGRRLSSGLAGRWAPAYYLRLLAERLGGGVSATVEEEGFTLEFSLPGTIAPAA